MIHSNKKEISLFIPLFLFWFIGTILILVLHEFNLIPNCC